MKLGKQIRKLRESKTRSLRKFANSCGISATYMSMIERDEIAPSADTIDAIAKELGVNGDLMAVEAGKIPEWMKALMLTEGAACVAAMREIEKQLDNK